MSTNSTLLTIRPVSEKDLQHLANLINFEIHVHRHLDWRSPLDWVGNSPYLIAEFNGEPIATLACPLDPPNVAWIRLFATNSKFSVQSVWDQLWSTALVQLERMGSQINVMAIPLHTWFRTLLEKSHYKCSNSVIVLSWNRFSMPPGQPSLEAQIRLMSAEDLPRVAQVDAEAFIDVWQNSLACLEVAYRQAAIASVAEVDRQMVGYQISTATTMGGHLARLAVRPQYQGRGIGYILLQDLLSRFERKGITNVTVNTQQDNPTSLALYKKAGFKETGEVYPVYQYQLHA
jgi:ribosomal protein S18 acetylase RimI-like enzyme